MQTCASQDNDLTLLDYLILASEDFLNDRIINAMIVCVRKFSTVPYCQDTFFCERLFGKRITREQVTKIWISILTKNFILIPLNIKQTLHWNLLVVRNYQKKCNIELIDSYESKHTFCYIKEVLQVSFQNFIQDNPEYDWSLEINSGVSYQQPISSRPFRCGDYLLLNILGFMIHEKFIYKKNIRERISNLFRKD